MNPDFIKLVHKIKTDRGLTILTDARKLRSLLADYAAGKYPGERRNFLLALEDGLVERMQREPDISEAFLRTQASFFASTYSLTEDAVQFVIWGWAEVLGLHINGKPVLLWDAGSVSAAGPQAVSAGSSANQAKPSAPPPAPNTKMPAITDKSFTNSIGMEFMLIPAGLFMMGSPETEKGRYSDETPHKVTITQPFYLGKYPVIQAQWQAVMGENPSYFNGDDKPVEAVSWNDVQRFIERLNQKEKTWRYRLPTEAEWEYAARAGSKTAWCFGDNENQLRDYAWYGEYCWETGSTHPVGQKKPNAWGLHDMHGNVWEWVQDWYAGWYYGASLPVDPQGPDSGADRVFRGGGWGGSALSCRSALRFHDSPVIRSHLLGFRVAFS